MVSKKWGRQSIWINVLLLVALLQGIMPPAKQDVLAATNYQTSPSDPAATLLQQMTPEEKIGQLFLVTFQGQDVGPETSIFDLITNHHIGGVVLLRKNDNITTQDTSSEAAINQLTDTIARLQRSEWDDAQDPQADPRTGIEALPAYAPLFIGIAQEGDGPEFDQIIEGVASLPNQMALGATWTPEMASLTGEALGRQLSALGVNLLLGPSLDVLDPPQIETASNLGTRTFGGDPYWVGRMGQAYIRGVHQGSAGRVSVVAKHFPGHGGSDRLPEEEVATVRRSLNELASFDLAPFLSVTGAAKTPEETTDGLLTSHIRYQGLQGNIRATTRPVSFDPQALALLLELPGLSTWRSGGGILVSDDLGNLAVRRFYDLTNQAFDPRRVALNAFLAGNDLLYIADFSSNSTTDSYTEAVRTLESFTQKYRDDAAFAQRVNESVLRILSLKLKMYPSFSIDPVIADPEQLPTVDEQNQILFSIAQEAATLLSPSQTELDNTIPDPPNLNDRIVFITDTSVFQPCSTCTPQSQLEVNALQNAVIRLYGPQAGGQVVINNLMSHSLEDLRKMLDGHTGLETLEQNLERSNWIVFSMLKDQADVSSFTVLRRFLNERPDLFQQKRVIVFSFTAPYFLDATDISKITAYYALYSKTHEFVDVAAYLLFGELRPTGAPPVSVPGINYNLNEVLFPDPTQTIPLFYDLTPAQPITATVTPEPAPPPEFRMGDVIPLRTGLIVDHNRHPVPDGTPVQFIFTLTGIGSSIRQTEYTRDGIARTTFAVNTPGGLEIRAESENAQSEILRADIPSPGVGTAAVTEQPTPVEPSPTPITPVVPPTPAPTLIATPIAADENQLLWLGDWLLGVFVAVVLGLGVYRLALLIGQVRWGIRAGLLVLIGGLVAYSYLAWIIQRSTPETTGSFEWSVFFSTIAGGLMGLLITFVWRFLTTRPRPPEATTDGPRIDRS